jgi:hypothetical protein
VRKRKKDYHKSGLPLTSLDRKTLPVTSIPENRIHFRFDYFDSEHSHFKDSQFTNEWPNKLLNRLKHFQQLTVTYFKTDIPFRQSQYIHPINWDETHLNGFGIHQGVEYDEDAWQFGLSKATGRIHGFFINNLFYIVWLDPEHKLFKYKDPANN